MWEHTATEGNKEGNCLRLSCTILVGASQISNQNRTEILPNYHAVIFIEMMNHVLYTYGLDTQNLYIAQEQKSMYDVLDKRK